MRIMVQADRIWADLARAQVRPLVKEDARLQADCEMRVLVQQLKVCNTKCLHDVDTTKLWHGITDVRGSACA